MKRWFGPTTVDTAHSIKQILGDGWGEGGGRQAPIGNHMVKGRWFTVLNRQILYILIPALKNKFEKLTLNALK